MLGKPERHPYNLPKPAPWLARLYNPSTAGLLTAALVTLGPSPPRLPSLSSLLFGDNFYSLQDVVFWIAPPEGLLARILGVVPRRLYVLAAGFASGYVCFHCAELLRRRTIRTLLTYTGWVYSPRSLQTKAWGILLALLSGVGSQKTFSLQSLLPKQPLPNLDATLDRWLSVSRQYVTKEEYEATKQAVEHFRRNEGPKLQVYLQNKAKMAPSWLADYWLTAAYLSRREPIAVNNNYYITTGFPLGEVKPDGLSRASTWIHNFARFDQMLRSQEIPPLRIMDRVPLCMNGYSFMFGTARIPGEHMDTIMKYSERHIIVIRKGHFFRVELYLKKNRRTYTLLTAAEIRKQLEKICDLAEDLPQVPSVAALTAQNRNVWAKQRLRLQENNREALYAVESSMFMFCLDKSVPKDVSELCRVVLTGNGNGNDRWYDKCITGVTFGNAMTGMNVEHSVIDATVFGTVCEYSALHERYDDNGQIIKNGTNGRRRELKEPELIQWNLEGLEKEVEVATKHCQTMAQSLDLAMYKAAYGKGFMKKNKISPDGFIQMMFQLAYYRLHKRVPKTYEPSTGRLFYLGRTETVHPGSPHSVAWLRAMDDPEKTPQGRQELLRKAVRHQNSLRLEATVGQGCDRHLLGLLCASRELGMDMPAIFTDKAWTLPYILSTSQTPTRAYEYGTPVDFSCASGGFGPGDKDGYGISYIIMGDDIIHIAITSWKLSGETSAGKLAEAIEKAMLDTKAMLSSAS